MAKFEFVKRFTDAGLELPSRGTEHSAGYDLSVAEDITIPRYEDVSCSLIGAYANQETSVILDAITVAPHLSLEAVAALTKSTGIKPTLVSTGVKCKLAPNQYLEVSLRSSTPLKYWLIQANSIGIIDSDYYGNPSNDGEIFIQLINLSPFAIELHKGDKIGQAIIKTYGITEDDVHGGVRTGGFGSTNE